MGEQEKMGEDKVRVIKIGKKALSEFIYENFIDGQEDFLDVDPMDVTNVFDINFARGEFICCTYKSENEKGEFLSFPEEIDLQKLMLNMPDTTSTMYAAGRYKEYTMDELVELSKK